MTVADTSPDLFPPIPPEPAAAREPKLRPLERRIIQAVALLCAVSGLLAVQWVDEKNNVEKNLKPPEKVVSVQPETVGEFLGARWMALKRETAQPLASGAPQGDVTELRFTVGVRPDDAAAAKLVGGYGLGYRFVDGEGRHWSADGTVVGARRPQPGVSSLITVKGTVPRAKADALKLEIQAPKASRKAGDPLLSLRFER
ncbi:hypothetical protein [Actinomadura livida]|uniref:Uncharacterized protein n=1 Tax=Actinomadura livida TaxID=79909 RepID=A0A7W7MWG6_9ACTN|nr:MULTISPECIES: hypothetical protein [Actinomadura]MBB4772792.1 hypothetical protein [Actinomadura catellatispora]GGU12767.1 hypothetical protein GCM10010208_42070 [Actinomadura livida]